MRVLTLSGVAAALLGAGCADDGGDHFPEARAYGRLPPGVTSAAECQAAQAQDPVLNC